LVNNFLTYRSRESPNRGRLPLSFFSNVSGTNLHTDEMFASGSNGVVVYNNAGGTGVQHFRESFSTAPNTSGVVIRITTNATGSTTPGLGGWYFADFAKINALHICYFTALVPAGYTINFHTNSLGTGNTNYWATNNVGTGKWENYAYVVQAGNGGNSSTMFFALGAGARPVTWYLARATSHRIG
jgi:hypothetical protein